MLIAMLIVAAAPASAQTPTIAGIWWTPEHDGKIAIVVDPAGVASGRLIAVARAHAADSDVHNPDASLRARPVLGLAILRDFRQEADGTWSGGTVYDPEDGRTYRGTLALDRDGRLRMRGYVGIELFGRTEILVRVGGPTPGGPQAGEPDLVYLPR
ncbi:MAG TPA: DUF2147 domain-containing protein [Alphaproteobacteria bacterium]|nr:DUF2147 domain-containing protein [Alphaproteobacteria bacterium]